MCMSLHHGYITAWLANWFWFCRRHQITTLPRPVDVLTDSKSLCLPIIVRQHPTNTAILQLFFRALQAMNDAYITVTVTWCGFTMKYIWLSYFPYKAKPNWFSVSPHKQWPSRPFAGLDLERWKINILRFHVQVTCTLCTYMYRE